MLSLWFSTHRRSSCSSPPVSAAVTMVSCSTPRSSLWSPSSSSPSPLMPCNISRLMRLLSSNDSVSSQASSHLCWTSPGVSHLVVKRTFIYIFPNRRPYNLYCVGADVKPCSINQSVIYIFHVCWTSMLSVDISSFPWLSDVVYSHSKSFHSPYVSPTEESCPNAEPLVSIDAGHSFHTV